MTEKGTIKLNIEISADNNKNWKMELAATFHSDEKADQVSEAFHEQNKKPVEKLYEAKVEFKNTTMDLSDVLEKADAMLEHGLGMHGERFGA